MSAWIDAELAAESDPAPQPAPVEVEAPWVAVHFDRHVMLGASDQDPLDVDVVTRAPQQLASGHVAYHRYERVGGRPHEALSLRRTVQAELAVDAADDEVEAAQHLLRIVK